MKLWFRAVGLVFLISLVMALPALSWSQENFDNTPSESPVETCEEALNQQREQCEMSARYCSEIYKYDAYNQIRPCAHYATECNLAVQKVEEICFPPPHSQAHLQSPGHPS